MSVPGSWKRIRAWYKGHTPPNKLRLAHGATKAAIDDLESLVGVNLPRDFRESYLLHNGSDGSSFLIYGIIHPVAGIVEEWKRYCDWQQNRGFGLWHPNQVRDPRIKSVWWNPLRLPLTDNGGGDPLTLDLDPAEGGTVGQVIDFNHEVGPTDFLADGFGN